MTRGIAVILLLLGTFFVTDKAIAGGPKRPVEPHPPKFERVGFGEYVRYRDRYGNWRWRLTYRGARDGFAPPAIYSYGMPHDGFSYGWGLGY
jgi:hypothetical protein